MGYHLETRTHSCLWPNPDVMIKLSLDHWGWGLGFIKTPHDIPIFGQAGNPTYICDSYFSNTSKLARQIQDTQIWISDKKWILFLSPLPHPTICCNYCIGHTLKRYLANLETLRPVGVSNTKARCPLTTLRCFSFSVLKDRWNSNSI